MESFCHGYMCMLLYMKLIWCSGFPQIYAWLEEGVSVSLPWWLRYMYILLDMKLLCCSGVTYIYCQLEEGWGQSAMGICAFCSIWNLFGVVVFQRSMLNWRRGVWSICHDDLGVYELYYMCNCFGVVVLYKSIETYYIWNLFGVVVFQRSTVNWRRDGVCLPWWLRYMCNLLYMKLLWCSGVT